ncbi:uncharacterized protein LOC124413012 [Diprion similis]|uniref:uncharacterized protein LOC124413012 n=1 Tax=Diprion similis TaxID=362088 RepID=UPI001EF8BA3E|nr:uncharacterized protein LOC124413012 [Diprion similis]
MVDYKLLSAICDGADISLLLTALFSIPSLYCQYTGSHERRMIRAEMIVPIIVVLLYLLRHSVANARVFYLDEPAAKEDIIGYENLNDFEQSSRDLDLSFSTGDTSSNYNNYHRDVGLPIFKRINPVRPYGILEQKYAEIKQEMDRPHVYYKLIEVPEQRPRFKEVVVDPRENAKWAQVFREDRKGEVILELRIITNNDAV